MTEYTDTEKELILRIADLVVDSRLRKPPFDALPYPSVLDDYLESKYVQGLPEKVREEVLAAVVEGCRARASGCLVVSSASGGSLLDSVQREMMLEKQDNFIPIRHFSFGGDARAIRPCITEHMKTAFPDFVREKKGEMVSTFSGMALVFSKVVNDGKLYIVMDEGSMGKGRIDIDLFLDFPRYSVSLKQFFGLRANVRYHSVEGCASELSRVMPFLELAVSEVTSIVGGVPSDLPM